MAPCFFRTLNMADLYYFAFFIMGAVCAWTAFR